jgi:Ni/Fe-hydrogenase subunit HybB-like protein
MKKKEITMKTNTLFKLTFWKSVGLIIVSMGIYATYIRFTQGLGAVTNLSDEFPWGLWIGFDILCGVGLAAGGFTICAVTHIFNIERFKPLVRPAILTAFLGYLLVVVALMYDLGKPYNIWHAIIMWNPASVMFEVAWCVMLYSTVLFLEFSPIILEKYKLTKLLKIVKKALLPLMIIGILLSTLHQSSLGSLYLIVPTKMHPLWYSPFLPVFFFLSAISTGFAMVIFESYLSARAFNHGLKISLLAEAGKIVMVMLILNFLVKMIYFGYSDKLHLMWQFSNETYLFHLEMILGTVIPVILLSSAKLREDKKWLYISSTFVIGGFLLNRMNVSITSIAASAGVTYFPSWTEISITMMIVVIGMWAFKMIVKNFPVFTEEEHEAVTDSAEAAAEVKPIVR